MKKIILIAATALLTLGASAQVKIGRVNSNELVQLTDDYLQAMKTISAAAKEADETSQSMIEEFNTKLGQYQQKASTWTDAIRQNKEKELTEIRQRIEEFQQTIQQELAQQQNELMAPIVQKVQEAVQSIAKSKGLTVLFDDASMVYFDEASVINITPDARQALNIPATRTLETLQQEIAALQGGAE